MGVFLYQISSLDRNFLPRAEEILRFYFPTEFFLVAAWLNISGLTKRIHATIASLHKSKGLEARGSADMTFHSNFLSSSLFSNVAKATSEAAYHKPHPLSSFRFSIWELEILKIFSKLASWKMEVIMWSALRLRDIGLHEMRFTILIPGQVC